MYFIVIRRAAVGGGKSRKRHWYDRELQRLRARFVLSQAISQEELNMSDSRFKDNENHNTADSYDRWREQWRSPTIWAVIGAAMLVVFVLSGIMMINYDNPSKLDAKSAEPTTIGQGLATDPLAPSNPAIPNPRE
jgi:hypothetical protein